MKKSLFILFLELLFIYFFNATIPDFHNNEIIMFETSLKLPENILSLNKIDKIYSYIKRNIFEFKVKNKKNIKKIENYKKKDKKELLIKKNNNKIINPFLDIKLIGILNKRGRLVGILEYKKQILMVSKKDKFSDFEVTDIDLKGLELKYNNLTNRFNIGGNI